MLCFFLYGQNVRVRSDTRKIARVATSLAQWCTSWCRVSPTQGLCLNPKHQSNGASCASWMMYDVPAKVLAPRLVTHQ